MTKEEEAKNFWEEYIDKYESLSKDDSTYIIVQGHKIPKHTLDEFYALSIHELQLYKKHQGQRINVPQKHHTFKNYSFFLTIKYLIPNKRREEILGDLMETKIQMIQEGIPSWKIRTILYFHIICIMLGMLRVRLNDYGTNKKIDKTQ